MSADIFISYSSDDQQRVMLIVDTLKKSGFSVWFDKNILTAGQEFAAGIFKGIDGCKVFILIISHAAMSSPWVQNELTVATQKNKHILPIFFEEVELDESLSFHLVRFHHLLLPEVTPETIAAQVIPSLVRLGVEPDTKPTSPSLPPSPSPSPSPSRSSIGVPHAVVIGISQYQDPGIPDLKYAAKDAQQIAETLTERAGFPADNVTLLTDQKATQSQIQIAITELRSTAEDDLVLFYFAGHGRADVTAPEPGQKDKLVWKYLVTHDAQDKYLDLTALSLEEMQKRFTSVPSLHQIYLLDSCYSGHGRSLVTPNSTRGQLSEPDWGNLAGEERLVLAACQASEVAYEYDDANNGLFTHFLIRGLGGEAAAPEDGVVYVENLYAYLLDRVPQIAERELGGRQHPVLYGDAHSSLPLTFRTQIPSQIPAPEASPLEEAKGLYRAGECDKAIQLLEEFLPQAGEQAAEVYCWLGKCHHKSASLDAALSAFESAIENGKRDLPTLAEAYLGKGEVLSGQQDFGQAIEAYRAAALLDETYSDQYASLHLDIEQALRTDSSNAINYLHPVHFRFYVSMRPGHIVPAIAVCTASKKHPNDLT